MELTRKDHLNQVFRLPARLLKNLFPSRCIICNKTMGKVHPNPEVELCISCYRALPFNDAYCLKCALPLAEKSDDVLCGRCIKKQPEYDYAHSVFRYEDDVITLVHQLKFSEKITYARSIGELLLESIRSNDNFGHQLPDRILPVPLHSSRLKQRGFNQSIEIARVISKKLKIPIEYDAVIRKRSTVVQTGLNAKQRKLNIKNAFSIKGSLKGKHILIVDDVVTTGSTVNEIARLLKKHGVESVGILSIARAGIG